MSDTESSPVALLDARASRRAFLRRVVRISSAVVTIGAASVIGAVRTGGYVIAEERKNKLRFLSPWQLVVVDAVAARMCASDVADGSEGAPPTALECGVGEFVDGFVAACERSQQREISALLGFVEHAWPIACAQRHRFTALDEATQDSVLTQMQSSSSELVRGAFHGLKSLVMMGYYRDARTWGLLGYDGPIVDRPEHGGWTPVQYLPRKQGTR